MKFGLFLQPVHHVSRDPTEALEDDFVLVEQLDGLGYDEVWVGEHHSTGWENIAAPEVFIAAAAERTKQIRLGTGVVQLGLHHPLVVLDRMILLDHMTRGRAMFGVGVGGGLPSDLRVMGLTPAQAGARMEESLEVMMRLLTDTAPVSVKTDWFEIHEAMLQLAPYSRPHMQLAMASTNPRNAETMGRYGGLILAGAVPERVPELADAMRRGGAKSGRPAGAAQIRLSYAMHLADSREQAIEEFRDGAIMEHYDFHVAVNGVQKPHEAPDQWYQTYLGRNLIGDPDDAIARIEEIEEKSGGVGGLLFTSRDWAGPEAAKRSWELFAGHVAPRFRGDRG